MTPSEYRAEWWNACSPTAARHRMEERRREHGAAPRAVIGECGVRGCKVCSGGRADDAEELPVARVLSRASAWSRIRSWLRRKLHRCQCRIYETDEGIGGLCVECGLIHGWMTREELRRATLMPHIVPVMPIPGDGAPRS